MLLNHLPQEMQILRLCGLSGLLSNSVFWDIFLMHLTFFQFFNLSLFATLLAHVRCMRLAFRLHAVFSLALVSSAA